MSSTNEVDWAKAAAAWASQRQKMQNLARPNSSNFVSPSSINSYTPSTMSLMTQSGTSVMMYPNVTASSSIPYMNPMQRPPGSVIAAPPTITSPYIPRLNQPFNNVVANPWFMSNLLNTASKHTQVSSTSSMMRSPSTGSSVMTNMKATLIHPAAQITATTAGSNTSLLNVSEIKQPTSSLPFEQKYDFEDLDEFIRDIGIIDIETHGLVKKRVTSIMTNVTDPLLNSIAREALNEAHLRTAQLQKQQQDPKFHSTATLPLRQPNSILMSASNASGYQAQNPFAPTPVQPVLLGEAGSALEEDHDDLREDRFNDGLPYIVTAEPSKGIFRSPADGIILPNDTEGLSQSVRVICYTRNGEILGELDLAGRSAIIFGSNPRQANIIDSHPSIYSQHCAIAVCAKPQVPSKSEESCPVPCSLYLFPLGGTTRLYECDQIPFLNKSLEPLEANDEEAQSATDIRGPPADLIFDGDRTRKIPPEKQIFLQLSSSQRYYMIDASAWQKTHVTFDADAKPKRFYSSNSLEQIKQSGRVTSQIQPKTSNNSSNPLHRNQSVECSLKKKSRSHESKSKSTSKSKPSGLPHRASNRRTLSNRQLSERSISHSRAYRNGSYDKYRSSSKHHGSGESERNKRARRSHYRSSSRRIHRYNSSSNKSSKKGTRC